MRSWQDECAVFGIWNHPEASRMAYLGLYALQHRGQEASGIVSLYDKMHLEHKGFGLVADVFPEEALDRLKGPSAIGHNRYSTTGQNELFNIQPLKAVLFNGPVSLAHNGNIVN
ncbi:MAG: amidophosphoribosyltransferase, partial [Bdellovibrionaceae bacterium]|nr:amidophosphoribosyltransferase [Pseudobdellovibrionaceae bacterium]